MLKQLRNASLKARLPDEIRFLQQWFDNPLKTGAVAPSSPALARRMASYINPEQSGNILELGPGTGAVTHAVLERGIDPKRVIAVEYSSQFVDILSDRFAGATVVQGDAYRFETLIEDYMHEPLAAVVSSLPLFTKPMPQRKRLIDLCLKSLAPGAPFIQFSYALVPPVPTKAGHFDLEVSNWVVGNLPPARVWVYRRYQN
ncbi:MAG: methyltransferase domain-containing protein [Cohaesibacter sp.]|nr:methyltransferase domain-containing protein [Cohaesibacter sp.]